MCIKCQFYNYFPDFFLRCESHYFVSPQTFHILIFCLLFFLWNIPSLFEHLILSSGISTSRGCGAQKGGAAFTRQVLLLFSHFGTSLMLAKDHNLIFYISQSIGAVLLWCFLLFSGFRFPGSCLLLSSCSRTSSHQLSGPSLSLWSQSCFACEVLLCFPTGLVKLLGGKVRLVHA